MLANELEPTFEADKNYAAGNCCRNDKQAIQYFRQAVQLYANLLKLPEHQKTLRSLFIKRANAYFQLGLRIKKTSKTEAYQQFRYALDDFTHAQKWSMDRKSYEDWATVCLETAELVPLPTAKADYLMLAIKCYRRIMASIQDKNSQDYIEYQKKRSDLNLKCAMEYRKHPEYLLTAQECLMAAVMDDPQNHVAWYHCAISDSKNYEYKINCLKQAIAINKNHAEYFLKRADYYWLAGDYIHAVHDYAAALRRDPKSNVSKDRIYTAITNIPFLETQRKFLYECLSPRTALGKRMHVPENFATKFFDPNMYERLQCDFSKGTLGKICIQLGKIDPENFAERFAKIKMECDGQEFELKAVVKKMS